MGRVQFPYARCNPFPLVMWNVGNIMDVPLDFSGFGFDFLLARLRDAKIDDAWKVLESAKAKTIQTENLEAEMDLIPDCYGSGVP